MNLPRLNAVNIRNNKPAATSYHYHLHYYHYHNHFIFDMFMFVLNQNAATNCDLFMCLSSNLERELYHFCKTIRRCYRHNQCRRCSYRHPHPLLPPHSLLYFQSITQNAETHIAMAKHVTRRFRFYRF